MYSLEQFATMFSDKVRMDAYSTAIAKSVRPNDAVMDLGCWPARLARGASTRLI
jgi:hypothetical protein